MVLAKLCIASRASPVEEGAKHVNAHGDGHEPEIGKAEDGSVVPVRAFVDDKENERCEPEGKRPEHFLLMEALDAILYGLDVFIGMKGRGIDTIGVGGLEIGVVGVASRKFFLEFIEAPNGEKEAENENPPRG